MTQLNADITAKREAILALIASYGSCAVAYSGGVDSAVVAKAAQLAVGDRAVAVTGTSASLAEGELEQAIDVARLIGIRHEQLATLEVSNPAYASNAPDRCFHCKTELYARLAANIDRLAVAVIVNGTNADDLVDYRPGLQAAFDFRVRSPLAECKITKSDVRLLATSWLLPVADKPASPCLSSRIAYGEAVTPERLAMIDRAEQYVRRLGFAVCRVRYHAGDHARVEVPRDAVSQLCAPSTSAGLTVELKRLGFRTVTIDPDGFRSGSLNEGLALHQIDRVVD